MIAPERFWFKARLLGQRFLQHNLKMHRIQSEISTFLKHFFSSSPDELHTAIALKYISKTLARLGVLIARRRSLKFKSFPKLISEIDCHFVLIFQVASGSDAVWPEQIVILLITRLPVSRFSSVFSAESFLQSNSFWNSLSDTANTGSFAWDSQVESNALRTSKSEVLTQNIRRWEPL